MNIRIRRAKREDVPAISALSQRLFEHERQYTDEFDMGWSEGKDGKEFFTKRIGSRSSFVFLAEFDGRIVGYILIKIDRFAWRSYNPIAEITNLSVDPMYRGQRVGTKLLDYAKAMAKKRGAKRMTVEALTDNEGALRFYRARGFMPFSMLSILKID